MNKLIVVLAFVFSLVILPSASAVRLGPVDSVVNFQPNLVYNYTFSVASDRNVPTYHLVEINYTDLAPYVDFPTSFTEELGPYERRFYTFTISLPSTLEPGDHGIYVSANIAPDPNVRKANSMGAVARVGIGHIVRVPYPGIYAKVDELKAPVFMEPGKEDEFVASVHSYGNQRIVEATGTLNIIDPFNKVVFTGTTNTESIEPEQTVELWRIWTPPEDVSLGLYKAEIAVDYDGGNTAKGSTEFRIGEQTIKIAALPDGLELVKDSVTKHEIQARSYWSETIENTYAEIKMGGKGSKSEPVTFKSLEEKNISLYIDTNGLEPGDYVATAIIHYGNKSDSKDFNVKVTSISKKTLYSIIGIAVTAIILILVLAVFLTRRRKKK